VGKSDRRSLQGEVKEHGIEKAEIYREENEKPSAVSKNEYDFFMKEFKKK
jgi:hypothetical protein